jgi:outer membrane biogenesis lipoprotein LolB
MKTVFIISALALGLLTSCSENANKEPESSSTETVEQPANSDTNTINNTDSIKTAADKAAKDSADAAHGHSH